MRKSLLLSGFLILFSGSFASAEIVTDASANPVEVMKSLGAQTVTAAKIEDKDARRRALIEAAVPAMDMNAIGAAVLNNAGVRVPSDRLAEVMQGVIAFVSREVIGEIEKVRPAEAKIGEVLAKGDDQVRVSMSLTGAQDAINAQWVLKRSESGWRVVDVLVSGNSLAVHFGGQLSRRARGEVDQLVDFLKSEQKRDRVASLPN